MLLYVNYFKQNIWAYTETYLLLESCPPGMMTPIWPHATGSPGLYVTSSKNDPDLTAKINYIMDSTETIKLATTLSTTIWTRVHCFLMIVFKIKELNNSVNPRVKTNL